MFIIITIIIIINISAYFFVYFFVYLSTYFNIFIKSDICVDLDCMRINLCVTCACHVCVSRVCVTCVCHVCVSRVCVLTQRLVTIYIYSHIKTIKFIIIGIHTGILYIYIYQMAVA